MDRNKSFTSINNITQHKHGHIGHVTLIFTILLLIMSNGCAGNKGSREGRGKDLKSRCWAQPRLPVCRGGVLKRAIRNNNLDLLFDDYLRSKLSRSTWNMQNKLTNKERNYMYDNNQSSQRIKNNKLKLLDRLLQIRQIGETDSTARYARHRDRNAQNANDVNIPDFRFSQYTENDY